MAYSDPQYNVRIPVTQFEGLTTTQTFTASAQAKTATNVDRIQFVRACVITGGRALITTTPACSQPVIVLMRGTNTAAYFTISTNTATTGVALTTGTYNTFTANEELGINFIGTGTASAAQVNGVYDIVLEYQEQFA